LVYLGYLGLQIWVRLVGWLADDGLDFSLRLPGLTVHATKFIDEKNHDLRYVLKNRETGEVYFVVMFTLILLDKEKEPEVKERSKREIQESTEKHEENEGKLGKFEWEPEPSAGDVE
jgi:hypothetical protein